MPRRVSRFILSLHGELPGSALIGILAYVLLFKFIARITRGSTSTLQLLMALTGALPVTTLSERFKSGFEHFLSICLIGAFGWLLITFVQVVSTLITTRYSIAVADNLHARRIHTQTQVLQRVIIVCIIVVTIFVILMTFPGARQIGTSVFASAGIAGVIVGMAARSTFASLIAGLDNATLSH